MATKVEIDAQSFYERLKYFYDSWKASKDDTSSWNGADSIVINVGESEDVVSYQKSISLHIWLFGYEFPETVLLFNSSSLKILTSQKKAQILKTALTEKSVVPIEFVVRTQDTAKDIKPLLDSISKSNEGKTYGLLAKEKPKGKFIESWLKELAANTKLKQIDITPAIADVLSHKDTKEQKNVRTAATISAFVLKNTLVPELETVIDENQKIKHISLAEKTEKIFEDPSKISKKLSKDHVDSCYTPIIQSGGNYSLKPNAVSDENLLQFGTIICSLGAKYKSYCSNVARTYLVDPIPSQNEVYQLCFDIQQVLITSMKSGVKLSSLYNKAIDMIKSHKSELVEKFTKNCGSGIGLEFRETLYTISEKCDHVIKPGMCFNLALGFENIEMPSGSKYSKYSIFLADTILIKDDGEAEVLTEKAPKKLADITYYLENEAANANSAPVKNEEKEKPKPKAKPIPTTLSQIVESKFRESTIQRKEEKEKLKEAEEKRREHQRMLEEKQKEEAVARFNTQVKKTNRHDDSKIIEAYKDLSQYPKDLPRSKLFIDTQREVIFLPIYGLMVPFHISTIKNASKTEDCLRLNFVTPDSTLNVAAKSEPIKNPKAIRIKEITYKMPDQRELNNSLRLIKELRKRMNVRETEKRESANLIAQEKLVLSKGRNPRLADVFVRPNPVGRRSNGVLEAHTNGFRFTMNKGEIIDILFHNIKQAFFQPAERELIILVHFHLHNPIMVGKKKTQDVQFCTEVMEVSQALDGRRYDADELEDEQRERQMRQRLNTEFQNFVKRVEEASGLEFDIPYRDLGFHGVPHRSSVFLQPTVHCLVNLTETPFFVLSLDDLEIAYFERVQFSLKNFDLVFVFKDYSKPVCHINSIAVESLDTIKEWLDQCDIKYYEGTQNLNWQRIMATIADDPVKFHSEDGGWAFLNPDSDDEQEKLEDAAESDFEPERDDDDAYGEDDDDDEDQYSENSDEDEFEEEPEDDEGEDWDALEAKAREQDERRDEKKRSRGDYSDSDEEDRRTTAGKKKKR